MSDRQSSIGAVVLAWLWGVGVAFVGINLGVRFGGFEVGPAARLWLGLGAGAGLTSNLLLGMLLTGRAILRAPLLRDLSADAAPKWLAALTMGWFAWTSLLMLPALFTGLAWWPLILCVTALAIVSVSEWCRLMRERSLDDRLATFLAPVGRFLRPRYAETPEDEEPGVAGPRVLAMVLGVIIGCFWALPYLLRVCLPQIDWDTLAYHLPLAEQYLTVGVWPVNPLMESTAFPGQAHLLYAVLLALAGEQAVTLLNLATSFLVIAAATALANRHWGKPAAWVTLAALISTNFLWELGVDARVELIQAFFVVASVAAVMAWDRQGDQPGWLIIAGAACGLGMSTKYTAVLTLAGVGVIVLALIAIHWREHRANVGRCFVIGVVCIAMPAGIWYIRNQVQVHNPLYAHGGSRFANQAGEPELILPAIHSLLEQHPEILEQSIAERERVSTKSTAPETLWNWWSILTDEWQHGRRAYLRISPVLPIFFLLIIPLALTRDRRMLWLLLVVLAMYLPMAPRTYLLRYIIPIIPLMAIGAAVVLTRRPTANWPAAVVAGIVCLSLTAWTIRDWRDEAEYVGLGNPERAAKMQVGSYLAGRYTPAQWLCVAGQMAPGCWMHHINEGMASGRLPADAKVMVLAESRGWYLEAQWLPDLSGSLYPFWQELINAQGDLEQVHRSLLTQGYTHVVISPSHLAWVKGNRHDRIAQVNVGLHYFQQYIDRYGQLEYTAADKTVVIAIR